MCDVIPSFVVLYRPQLNTLLPDALCEWILQRTHEKVMNSAYQWGDRWLETPCKEMEARKRRQLIPVLPVNTSGFCLRRQRTLGFEVQPAQVPGMVVRTVRGNSSCQFLRFQWKPLILFTEKCTDTHTQKVLPQIFRSIYSWFPGGEPETFSKNYSTTLNKLKWY